MPGPAITKQPQSVTVSAGEAARFVVEADGDGLQYQWRRDGVEIAGANQKSYELKVRQQDSGAKFRVHVRNAEGSSLSDEAALTVVQEAPLLYDPKFAWIAGGALMAAFLVILWPIWIIAGRAISDDGDTVQIFPAIIAIQFVIIGALIALAGFYMVLLDFRGRARTFKQLQQAPAEQAALGPVEEAVKSIPEAIKAFAQLKAPAALLVVSVALFIAAAAIAWRALPEASQSTEPTATTAPTTSSAP